MKKLLPLISLLCLPLSSCFSTMPTVPPNTHPVVGPSGSSDGQKSWSRLSKQEGDALLGPLGNTERR